MPWQKVRIFLLATILGSILLVLGKSLVYPTTANNTVTPFVFPEVVSLPQWQLVKSTPLTHQIVEDSEFHGGKHYRYIQDGLPLDIEMRYLINTNGDIKQFIRPYTGQLAPVLYERPGIGVYSMFVHQGYAYLNACINPRGSSTVTADQFKRNSDLYNVRWDRLVRWSISSAKIQDRRCLWANLSVPVQHPAPENTYKILETAWFSWYSWWSQNFPNP
ncbi:MAG TPA: cyanoexosortase A system-associated protein [Cyanobacteria bacterium UBA8803]|nr:cyanoexosortase A system-associated protein [Cyanobacteria bacterium UBA9273]HBL60535.1 cyanoexosortase A system-associated protein [Cyanobacteria bacterium UBA8803]